MANFNVTPIYTETAKQVETTDKVIASFVNGYYQIFLNNEAYLNQKTDKTKAVGTYTLQAASWQNNSAPYVYKLSVSGITANDNPVVSVSLPSSYTLEQAKNVLKAFGRITRGVTYTDAIWFYADYQLPSVNIPIIVKGI